MRYELKTRWRQIATTNVDRTIIIYYIYTDIVGIYDHLYPFIRPIFYLNFDCMHQLCSYQDDNI